MPSIITMDVPDKEYQKKIETLMDTLSAKITFTPTNRFPNEWEISFDGEVIAIFNAKLMTFSVSKKVAISTVVNLASLIEGNLEKPGTDRRFRNIEILIPN
jgi:hypothetical protein